MDEKEKKKGIVSFLNRPKVRFINWLIVSVFAIIFGIFTGEYGVSIAFFIIMIIKYFEMKYPDLL